VLKEQYKKLSEIIRFATFLEYMPKVKWFQYKIYFFINLRIYHNRSVCYSHRSTNHEVKFVYLPASEEPDMLLSCEKGRLGKGNAVMSALNLLPVCLLVRRLMLMLRALRLNPVDVGL